MKKLIFIFLIPIIGLIGCSNQEAIETSRAEGKEIHLDINNWPDFYIVSIMAVKEEEVALVEVEKLRKKGYPSGYLWIPDYESLGDEPFYSVFVGPFFNQKQCEVEVEKYKKVDPETYGVLVSHEERKVRIEGIGIVKEHKGIKIKADTTWKAELKAV